ncbi:MAG: hypothetical protein OXC62_02530, partial [Aestuariivita sp.]|nr:hypothetical protein [Aestuariivita sp.]
MPQRDNEGSPIGLSASQVHHAGAFLLLSVSGQRSAGVGLVGDVADDRPDEAHKFPRHCGGDLAGMLVGDAEPAVAA